MLALMLWGLASPMYADNDDCIVDPNLHLLFKLDETTKEAVITNPYGIESNALKDDSYMDASGFHSDTINHWKNLVIPSSITYNGEVYTIVGIGSYAFNKTTEIFTIQLPNTIRSIGDYAFRWCVNLETIDIPDEVTDIPAGAFDYCWKLKSIKLSKNVRSIGAGAFSDCYALTSISIPGSCEYIGDEAFKWCIKLNKIKFEDGAGTLRLGYNYDFYYGFNTSQSSYSPYFRGAFSECPIDTLYLGRDLTYKYSPFVYQIRFPVNSSSIYDFYIQQNSKMGRTFKNVEFGETVTTIPDELFYFAYINNEIKLPSGLKKIGKDAFHGNGTGEILNQSRLVLPASLEEIGDLAFLNCSSLRFIHCQGVTPPVGGGFTNCTVYVPSGYGPVYRTDSNWGKYTIIDPSDEFVTINVKTAGTLYSRMLAQEIQANTISRLKIKGTLNEDDWGIVKNMVHLYEIDLSELALVELPNGIFQKNNHLVHISLPHSLKIIGENAFQDCFCLTGVLQIPSSCDSVGANAFYRTSITGLDYQGSLHIGQNAFRQCKELKTLILSGEETEAGDMAFWGSGIRNLTISKGVSIADQVFEYCQQLEEITLEDGVKSIGNQAFYVSTNINKLNILGKVGSFGSKLFDTRVSYDLNIGDIASWCSFSFGDVKSSLNYLAKQIFIQGQIPVDVEIPQGVKSIGDYAFYNCASIETIILPEGLEVIGNSSFEGCKGITQLHLPNSITSIGTSAFKSCSNIADVDLPTNIGSLGEQCFSDCYNLQKIVAHWGNPVIINQNTYANVSNNCFLYIPIGTATKYANAGWTSIPNVKETGILSVHVNSGGYISCNETQVCGRKENIFFTPYKSFVIKVVPNDGNKIFKATLNGTDITNEVNDEIFIEEPEEDYDLFIYFTDSKVDTGDVNCDGIMNVTDILCMANYIINRSSDENVRYIGDMNDDGIINITDVIIAVNKILSDF